MKLQYIDIFKLWNQTEADLNRPIAMSEVVEKSGVTQPTVSRMKRGVFCDPVKMGAVAEALYDLSGMQKPARIDITWLE